MKRKTKAALSIILAVLMAVISPLQTFAESNVEYISEIRIGYGEDGKKQLQADGYTIMSYKNTDLNANEGGKGSAVYLGYMTTDKKEEAITDLAIMPMRVNGVSPFSFDEYEKEMEKLSSQIDTLIENFDAAINEFRTNLNKPAPQNDYAKLAYEVLNMYVEDDSGLGVGELFAMEKLDDSDTDGSALKEVYHKILMTGNSIVVSAVEMALAIGCTETGGETFLDRLAKQVYTGDVSAQYNDAITIIANALPTLRDEVLAAKATYEASLDYDGGQEAYLNALDLEDKVTAVNQITFLAILQSVPYADMVLDGKQMTLYDVIMLPTEMTVGQVCLDASMLEPLAKAMTEGQIAITQYSPLDILITNAYSTTLDKVTGEDGIQHFNLENDWESLEYFVQSDKISVYAGVDRSIFDDTNYHTVAITSDALKSNALNSLFGTKSDYLSSDTYTQIGLAGACVGVLGLGTLIVACTKIGDVKNFTTITKDVMEPILVYYDSTGKTLCKGTHEQCMNYLGGITDQGYLNGTKIKVHTKTIGEIKTGEVPEWGPVECTTSVGTKVAVVAGAIAMAAGIALAIYGFVMSAKAAEPQTVTYDPIPRAIIDVRTTSEGEDKYFVYYCARLAGASDDYKNEKDTTKLYGDLNGLSGYEDWACLYYARDLRLGSPITTTILVNSTGSVSTLNKKNGYVPVHGFFDTSLVANNDYAAMNLNNYSTSEDAAKVYLFLKRNLKESPLTSSIVDDASSFGWVSVASFAVGAVLATGATLGVVNIKKKKKLEA